MVSLLTCRGGRSQHGIVYVEEEEKQSLPSVPAHHSALSGHRLNCTQHLLAKRQVERTHLV